MKRFDFLDANARRLFFGQLASQVCDRMTSIGLVWVVTEKFGAASVPWYLALAGLPHLLFSTKSGSVINRFGALKVVVQSDLFRALLYVVAAGLGFYSKMPLGALLVLVFLTNVAAAFFNPALLSLPLRIAQSQNLESLTALINGCSSTALVLGPLAAVLLYKACGLTGLFAVTSLAYLAAGLASLGIKLGAAASQNSEASVGKLHKPWSVLRADGVIFNILIVFFFMNLLFGPLQICLPAYARDIFLAKIDGLAWLEGCFGLGTIVGSAALTVIQVPGSRMARVTGGILAAALSYLAFTVSTHLWMGCLSLALLGLSLGAANVWVINFFQERPDSQDVPIIMSFVNLISVASLPFSMAVSGILLPHLTISLLAPICAALLVLLASLTFLKYFQTGDTV